MYPGASYWKPSRRWERFNRLLEKAYRLRRDQTKAYLYTRRAWRFNGLGVVETPGTVGGRMDLSMPPAAKKLNTEHDSSVPMPMFA